MRGAWILAGCALAACHPQRGVSARSWIAAGDATTASDPARALANYERASSQGATPAERAELDHKRAVAARAWAVQGLGLLADRAVTAEPDDQLATVIAIRQRLDAEHALDAGSATALSATLVAREEAIAQLVWDREVARARGSSVEVVAYLQTVRTTLPATAVVARAAADAELAKQRAELIARYDGYLAQATPSAGSPAGPTHAGARFLWGTVRAAVLGKPRLDTATRTSLASELGVTTKVDVVGCAAVVRAKLVVPIDGSGPHRALIRAAATSCTTSEATRDFTDQVEVGRRKQLVTEAIDPGPCLPAGEACVPDDDGNCPQLPVCPDPRPTRTYEADVPVYAQRPVKERTITATLAGTYIVIFDGKESKQTLQVTAIDREQAGAAVPGTAIAKQEWSQRTRADVLERAIREELPKAIQGVAAALPALALPAEIAAARVALVAGDPLAAEDAVAIALAGGATIPPDLAPLAARAGMPFDAWLHVIAGEPLALTVTAYAPGSSLLQPAQPDQELLFRESTSRSARADQQVLAADEALAFAIVDSSKWQLGAGAGTWAIANGDTSYGGTLALAARRGQGGRIAWFRHFEAAVAESGTFATSFDVHYQLALAARTRLVQLALVAGGGGSRRASNDQAVRDPGMPFNLDLGLGLELQLGPATHRVSFGVDRWIRPLVDPPGVRQRIRYQVQYAHLTASGGTGARAECTIEQDDKSDVWIATGDRTATLCSLSAFLIH